MSQLDQGSILFGIRSEKYPNSCCFGVVISASCDIANCKVPQFYYLVAVDAADWFSTGVGYNQVYDEKIKSLLSKLENHAQKHSLDATFLQQFSTEDFNLVIESEITKVRDRAEIKKAFEQFRIFNHPSMTDEHRKEAIREDVEPVKKFLESISKGTINHFYFLPQIAYRENGKKNIGLMVDLQEIRMLSLQDARMIFSPGIDYMLLPCIDEKQQMILKNSYWLNNESDFVGVDGIVKSPWREHLMQKFSHAFVRIGLDGSTKDDFLQLARSI